MTNPKNLEFIRKTGEIFEGRYRITKAVPGNDRGMRMSNVYFVEDIETREEWIMKEYMKYGIDNKDRAIRQGISAEIETLKNLRHPCIPYIADVFELQNSYVIIMEIVDGETLEDIVKGGPRFSEDVRNWMIRLCKVLNYLHSQKPPLIYRDVKPSNIMLTREGVIHLIDFGTVKKKYTREDAYKALSPGYAAPEQHKKESDERTDIYLIGVTMDQLLTGKLHQGEALQQSVEDLQRTCRMKGLAYIVKKCVEPNPDNRIQSIAELERALIHSDEFEEDYKNREKLKRGAFYTACAFTALVAILFVLKLFERKLTFMQIFDTFNLWMIALTVLVGAAIAVALFYILKIRRSRESKMFTDSIENRRFEAMDDTELILSVSREDVYEDDEEATALTSEEYQTYICEENFMLTKSVKVASEVKE